MNVKSYQGGKVSSREYDAGRFGDKVLYRTLKDAVDMFRANQRQGTVKTRGRSEVSGSRKKPWKQKHTGRARAGDKKSPIWRGGGTVFGPKPRDYSYHMPAKQRRVALRSAIYGKLADEEVVLVDLSGFGAPSSKDARALLAGTGAMDREPGQVRQLLVLTGERNEHVWKSFRNFPNLDVRAAADVCAHDVLNARIVLAEEAALDAIAGRVGVQEKAGGAA